MAKNIIEFNQKAKKLTENYLIGKILGQKFVNDFIQIYLDYDKPNQKLDDFFNDIHQYSEDANKREEREMLFDDVVLRKMVKEVDQYLSEVLEIEGVRNY